MYLQFYQAHPLLAFPLIGLVLFGFVYGSIVVAISRPAARERAHHDALLPLDDGEGR